MENSITSFIDRTKSDLITYYTKSSADKLNEKDVKLINDLLAMHGRGLSSPVKSVNLLLHTQGGNINAAIGLMEELRKIYTERINTIVIKGAKSSGAFMALASDDCYMLTGSFLSSFMLDSRMADKNYRRAQERSLQIAFQGLLLPMGYRYWLSTFVFTNKEHATNIPKSDLLLNAGVKKLSDFPKRTKALGYIHNLLVDELRTSKLITKIYGFNENLYRF